MKDDIAEFKKELVLKAACALFFERGYAGSTTEALTERLSISKTVIYSHFRSKAEILTMICERSVRFALDLAERVAVAPDDPAAKLRRLAREFTLIVIENQDYLGVSARERNALPVDSRRRISDMQERFDRLLGGIIAEGAARGRFTVPDPALAALAIAGMIIWIHSWYRADGRLTPAEIAGGMADTALRMVGG